jgi:cell division protein FtsW
MLVALLLVPVIGSEVNGARRWLNLGISLQPSEFLKPAFAIGAGLDPVVARARSRTCR